MMKIEKITLTNSNSYLIINDDNKNALLVDTGSYLDKDMIDNKLNSLLGDIKLCGIILTHGHDISSSNALYLSNKYNAVCYLNKYDLDLLSNSNGAREIYTDDFLTKLKLNKIKKEMSETIIDVPNNMNHIEGNDTFTKLGFSDVKVINLSGHTRGSIGILIGKKDLLCGDILVNNNGKITTNLLYEEKASLNNSLETIKDILPSTIHPLVGDSFNYEDYFKMEKIIIKKDNKKNNKKKK